MKLKLRSSLAAVITLLLLISSDRAILSLAEEDHDQAQDVVAQALLAPVPPIHDILTRQVPSTPFTYNINNNHLTGEAGESSMTLDPYEFMLYVISSDASELENSNGNNDNGTMPSNFHDDDDDDHDNDDDNTIPFELPQSIQDLDVDCSQWAYDGECNINPTFMLRNCIRSCLQDMDDEEEYDLLAWVNVDEPDEDDEDCYDAHTVAVENGDIEVGEGEEGCEDWAEIGLCKSVDDKPFMLERCQESCMVCIPRDEEGYSLDFYIGEPQEVIDANLLTQTLDIMIETSEYMSKTVMDTKNTKYKSVRRDCKNLDSRCSHFAAKGECDPESEHYEWMILNCAPVCQTCELLDYNIRCPIPKNAVEALDRHGGENGLHAMFERIVGERDLTQKQIDDGMDDLDYTVTIYSRPKDEMESNETIEEDVIDGPWVIALDNLFTDEECERLIELGQQVGYERSTETSTERDGSVKDNQVSDRRTSTNTFCDNCHKDPIAKGATQKIATITGFPVEFSEDLQLLQYHPGQYYKQHHDYIPTHKHGPSGPRVLTVLLYLNDVEDGGATRFNELAEGAPHVDILPKKGSALIWPSVLDSNVLESDERTEHEALVVNKGMKYAANAWLHLRDEKNFVGIACG